MNKPGTVVSVIIGLIMITGVVAISFLVSRDTKQRFVVGVGQALQESLRNDEVLSLQEFKRLQHHKDVSYVLIDIRSKDDYDKGHLDKAVHMYATTVLKEENLNFFKELEKLNKMPVLYSGSRGEARNTFLLLKQMGVNNISVLDSSFPKANSKNIIGNREAPLVDFSNFIKEENQKDLARIKKEKEQKKRIVKKVIYKKKKVSIHRKSIPKSEPEEEEDEGC